MKLSGSEIQMLASIEEACANGLRASRRTLEERAERYWIFKEDWANVFEELKNKDLIVGNEDGYELTELGQPLAVYYFAERPDLYWYYYQEFYDLAASSKTHSRFCEIVFGEDRSQEGQTDMACYADLLSRLGLRPGHHVLDLGCGAGGLSEYIVDTYGSFVTGIDYSPSAIRAALRRMQSKREKLNFFQEDLNTLNLPANTYDAAISIDSIYWVADLDKTISSIVETIKRDGLLFILIEHRLNRGEDAALLHSEHTEVAKSLRSLKLKYDTVDYSGQFLKFWPKVKETALSLRDDYLAEGTQLICDNWIREADEDYLPSVEAGLIGRYLYQVHV